MADFHIRVGNLLPEIESTLMHEREVAKLTGATAVQLRYRPIAGGAVVSRNGVFVGDLIDGKVKYAWVAGDTDVAGTYDAYWHVTYTGGKTQSFPSDGFFQIKITKDL